MASAVVRCVTLLMALLAAVAAGATPITLEEGAQTALVGSSPGDPGCARLDCLNLRFAPEYDFELMPAAGVITRRDLTDNPVTVGTIDDDSLVVTILSDDSGTKDSGACDGTSLLIACGIAIPPNATVTASVPEPASLLMLIIGLLGLALRRFRLPQRNP